jgi:hypothetical protein
MKTSTQSLVKTLKSNNLNAQHIHFIPNLAPLYSKDFVNKQWEQQKAVFLDYLNTYKTTNKKKLKIITVIRNPIDRIKSAFFQIHHNGEINNNNVLKENTTVSKLSVDDLLKLFVNKIENDTLVGSNESLDELSKILDTDIIGNLENKNTHYYYENKLIKLYVLDFNELVSKNALKYLNNILNFKLTSYVEANKSDGKTYYTKYKLFKEKCASEEKEKDARIESVIRQRFKPFYFDAFSNAK